MSQINIQTSLLVEVELGNRNSEVEGNLHRIQKILSKMEGSEEHAKSTQR